MRHFLAYRYKAVEDIIIKLLPAYLPPMTALKCIILCLAVGLRFCALQRGMSMALKRFLKIHMAMSFPCWSHRQRHISPIEIAGSVPQHDVRITYHPQRINPISCLPPSAGWLGSTRTP